MPGFPGNAMATDRGEEERGRKRRGGKKERDGKSERIKWRGGISRGRVALAIGWVRSELFAEMERRTGTSVVLAFLRQDAQHLQTSKA
jgi:hypothetical protein